MQDDVLTIDPSFFRALSLYISLLPALPEH